MNASYDYKKHAILYVDDEEQSLKYFRKAFDKDFRVLIATSVAGAQEIIDKEGATIGIVISDQRMPDQTGVDLFRKLRLTHPNVLRLLTTAYSDLESAIEGVNTGAIYKYVIKPWDIRELKVQLMRAMEFYMLQQERDQLLREKLSVLQRIVLTDRVQSLSVLAAGLAHHIRNSMTALITFLDLVPFKLQEEMAASALKNPAYWEDLFSLALRESQQILQIVQRVVETTLDREYSFNDTLAPAELMGAGDPAVAVQLSPAAPPIRGNAGMLHRLFDILTNELRRMGSESGITVKVEPEANVGGGPGVAIHFRGSGADWTDRQIATLFTAFAPSKENPKDLGLDLLSGFFIAGHHGGDIAVHRAAPAGPGFTVRLPSDPEKAERPSLDNGCMEKLFLRFEALDALKP